MRITKDKLKNRIIHRIDSLIKEKLKSVDEFIDNLEDKKNSKNEILSYAGIRKDLDEEIFQDWTEALHDKRAEGNDRIL